MRNVELMCKRLILNCSLVKPFVTKKLVKITGSILLLFPKELDQLIYTHCLCILIFANVS